MKIGVKLMILFVVIASISISIIGYLSYEKGRVSLEQESFNRLTAVREIKAAQIEQYFHEIRSQVITFSEDHTVIDAMVEFKKTFNDISNDPGVDTIGHNKKLHNYYTKEFLSRLNPNTDEVVSVKEHWPQTLNARILQDIFISSNPNAVGAKHNLTSTTDTSAYGKAHEIFHPLIRNYQEKFGYYDIFLIDDSSGNIVYSVFKEVDYGTSLITGPYAHTNFGSVFKSAVGSDKKDFVSLVDFEPYHPSYNAPASFIASPIYDNNKKIGVLVFQMPIDKINDIMTNYHEWAEVGLGNSGETYITSDDYTLRNQSRFLIEDRKNYFKMIEEIGTDSSTIEKIKNFNSSIGLQQVKTEGTIAALKGEQDTRIFDDYRGVSVLSSFKPLEIEGMNWVIMSEIDEEEAFAHVYKLRNNIVTVFFILIVLIVIASYFFARKITKPIKKLTGYARTLARGDLDVDINIERSDEIGILALSFKSMQGSIKKLIGELKDINHNLEEKVKNRTKALQHQKELMEEKNKEIVDSINYAQRLQNAILPDMEKVKEGLPDSFILFKPKDIVSGDFYWMANKGGKVLIAAVDCTGHGVPGAMVSVIGSNGLYRCIKEFNLIQPAEILDKLTDLVIETFDSGGHEVKDGMDIALCLIDTEKNVVEYAGANNPLWYCKKGEEVVQEIKADKQPIGNFDYRKPFTNHVLQLDKGDSIYFFTDGFADQFGGEKGKKFKYKPFRNLLLSNMDKPMEVQKDIIDRQFEGWMGEYEQVDDVCVIGVKL